MAISTITDFRSFIRSLLSKADINDEHLDLYTSDANIKRYQVAFTHKSVSTLSAENYETFEFEGDVVVNMCAVKWIRTRYPKIANVSWLTHMKHKIISQSVLGIVAEQYGFLERIRIGDDVVNRILNISNGHAYKLSDGEHVKLHESSKEHTKEELEEALEALHDDDGKTIKRQDHRPTGCGYLALLEDTFEAFIGATSVIVDSTSCTKLGVSIAVCFAIVSKMLDDANLTFEYEDLWDPITRVKQIAYDRKTWPINKAFRIEDRSEEIEAVDDDGNRYIKHKPMFKVHLSAWTKGDMSVTEANRVIISTGVGRSIVRAKNIASLAAIEELKKLGFVEYRSNPYKLYNT